MQMEWSLENSEVGMATFHGVCWGSKEMSVREEERIKWICK